MGRSIVLGTVGLAVFAVSLMVLTSVNVAADPAVWMDQNWASRRPVTINNPGGALSSYQVRVVVPYESSMKSDFSDLRFTDSNGFTLLPYWIENVAPPPPPPLSYTDRMNITSEWIFVGQDANGPSYNGYKGGVSSWYQSTSWSTTDYMEVTGYIIPTILDMYHKNNNPTYLARALSMADWEVAAQAAGGTGSAISYVYDTGMMMQGLLMAYRESSNVTYLNAAEWAASWILSRQVADGSYINCNDPDHDYHARADWILLQLYETTGNAAYQEAALKNLAWIYSQQNHFNGMYRTETYLHFINYVIEGMLESGELLKTLDGGANATTLGTQYVASAKQAADALLGQQRPDGSMTSDHYSGNWVPGGSTNTVSGDAQIALIWSRLFEIVGGTSYIPAAQNMISFIGSTQDISSADPNIRGCLDNSWPPGGQKIPWAAKFFIDALLNTPDPQTTPPSPPPVSEAIVWVKLPTIPAAGTKTIYVYYGNSAATSTSNGVAVFDFFDDFSGDLSKWTSVGGTWTIESGELSASASLEQHLRATGVTFTDGIVDGRVKWVGGAWFEQGFSVRGQTDDGRQTYSCHITAYGGANVLRIWKYDAIGSSSRQIAVSGSGSSPLGKWFNESLSVHGSTFEASASPGFSKITGTDSTWSSGTLAIFSWSGVAEHVHYDDVRIRKYAGQEPTTTLGVEEAAPFVSITFEASGTGVPVSMNYEFGSSSGSVSIPVGGSCNVIVPYGSTVSFSYASTVADGTGTQYALVSTNVASPLVNSVSDTTITGTYGTQYYLTMSTNFGSVSPGSGWYDAGSKVTISAAAPASGEGEQYVWNGWTGTGAGSYSGSGNPATNAVTMNGPITESASWTHQYYLTMHVSDDFGISGDWASPRSGWFVAGSVVNIEALPPGYSSGTLRGIWGGWTGTGSGSYTGMSNPASITMNGPIHQQGMWRRECFLTVISAYGTPGGSGWYHGSMAYATLDTGVVNGAPGVRYVFTGWSGDASGSGLTSNPINMYWSLTAIANWKVQYELTMSTNFGTVTPSAGSHWYDAGSTVTVSATAPTAGSDEQHVWNGWTGSGTICYTGTVNLASITLNSPITEAASWTHQYYLTMHVSDDFGISGDWASPRSGWFVAGSTVSIEALAPDYSSGTLRGGWNGWTGTGSGSYTGMNNPASITMNGPIQQQGMWKRECFLTVVSAYGTPGGSGWYHGGPAYATLDTGVVSGAPGVRYVFTGWSGDASGSGLSSNPINMYWSMTAIANWKIQYQVILGTNPTGVCTPTGAGWFDASTTATVSTEQYVPINAWSRYAFSSWTNATGTFNAGSVYIDGPEQVVANYLVELDLAPPTTASHIDGSAGAGGWFVSEVTLTLSATDYWSGVGSTFYRIDSGAGWSTYTAAFVVSGDGNHNVEYYSVDNAGNAEAPKSVPISIDTISSTTTCSLAGTHGSGEWFTSDVTVTLSSSDSCSGVARTRYALDGVEHPYDGPFVLLSPVARYTLAYWSVDNAGNIENPQSLTILIDKLPPNTVCSLAGTLGNSGWYRSDVEFTLSASDSAAGAGGSVVGTLFLLDGGAWQFYPRTPMLVSGEGFHTVQYYSVDSAGNIEPTRSASFKIDKIAPVSSMALDPPAPNGANGWWISDVSVSLSATDAMSGVASTQYRVNGGSWQLYSGSFVLGNGVHTLEYYSVDSAGNVEVTKSVEIKIFKIPPTSYCLLSGTVGNDGWYKTTVTVTFSGSTPGAGIGVSVASYWHNVDGQGWQSYPRTFDVSGDGYHTVQYYAVDTAGNVETTKSTSFKIDTTAPVTSMALNPPAPNGANGWYVSDVTVTLTAADSPSGVAETWIKIDTGSWQLYTAPVTISSEGSHTVEYYSVDNAGNVESTKSVSFKIDKTAPVVTITAPQDGGYYKSSLIPVGAFSVVEVNPYTTVETGWSIVEGAQTYTVTATDSAGNVGTAHVHYTVDDTAPVVTITSPSNGAYYKSVNVPDADYDVFDLNPWTVVESGYSTSEGVQTYTVTATDDAGNVGTASVTYTVDNIAPVVTILSPSDGAYYQTAPVGAFSVVETNPYTTVEAGWSNLEGIQTYTVTVTDGAGNVGSDSVTYTVDNTAPVVTISAPVSGAYYQSSVVPVGAFSVVEINPYATVEAGWSTAEGVHTYTVTATDSAGNVGTDSVTYTVDDTKPVVTITAPTDGAYYTTAHVPLAGYTVSDVNPWTVVESGYSTSEGIQTYTVTVTDSAGNVGSDSVTYTVDNIAPVVTITSPLSGAYYTTAHVPAAGYTVSELNPYTVVASGYLTSEGIQTYTVTVTDGAGNVGSDSVTYTVDNTAPVVTISAPLNGAYYQSSAVPVGAFSVVEINPYTTMETGWSIVEGAQTYTVTATDSAGNVGSAHVHYTVDDTAPVVTISAPTNGAYYKTSAVPGGAFMVVETNPHTEVESGYSTVEGVHTYTVTSTDAAGNIGSASVTYTVDNTPPVVTITAPVNGAYCKTSAMPPGAFTVVELNPYTTSSSGYSTAEGIHTYTVTATDGAGNEGLASVTYTVDNTAPVVTITAPQDGGYYKSSLVPVGAFSVVEINPYTTVETGWSIVEGAQTYTVTATDFAGNVGSDSVTYTVDNTAPVVAITSPLNGNYYKTADVPVGAFTATDSNGVVSTTEAGWANSPEGSYTYTVAATDAAGNVGMASVTYTVDNTPPVVTISAPSNGAYYQSVNVPAAAYGVVDTNPCTVVESGYSTSEGVHTYTVTATDAAGNVGSASVTYTVDNIAPVVTISAPVSGAYYQSSAVPVGAFSVVEANPYTTMETGWSIAEGVHTYTVTATDSAGNVGSDSVTCTVDDTAPVVTITSPSNGVYYKTSAVPGAHYTVSEINPWTPVESGYSTSEGVQTYTVTVTDSAGNSGTASVTYTVDNTAPVVTINSPQSGKYYKSANVPVAGDFSVVEINPYTTVEAGWSNVEGVRTYTVTATDGAGNIGSASVTYTVDNTAPVVTISAPSNGHFYKTANVPSGTFTATDSNGVVSHTEAGWANSPEGSYTYTVTACDAAGNVGMASVTYTVDNTRPVVTITAPQSGKYYKSAVVPVGAFSVVEANPYRTAQAGWSTIEGIHTYTVTATDGAGNVGSASVTYTVDNTAPVVTIFAPANGGHYDVGTLPPLAYTVSDNLDPSPSVVKGFYPDATPGDHTVTVTATDHAGNVGSASATYTVGETALKYTGVTSGQYSDPVTVSATLTDVATGLPISGKTILFTLGAQTTSATTGANGVAEASITLNQQMGSYTVYARFAGGIDYLGSFDQAPFTINQERAVPEYTGVTIVPTSKIGLTGPIQLQATIYEDPDSYFGDLTKITVTFMIDGNVVGTSPVTVGAPGIGVAQLTISGLREGDHEVIVKINDNNYYTIFPTSDVVVLEVYVPTGSFVTGGGWITDSGSKGSFGFTAKYLKSSSVQGHMTYVYRVNGLDYIVKSTALSGLGVGIDGTHAYFEGKCVVRIYDPATGATSWNDGNYKFRIDVYDNGEPGSKDAFQITVRDKNGVVWHQAGVPPPGTPPSEYGSYGVLKGGNIVVHVEKSARSASVAAQSLNPALATAIFSLLAVGLLLSKGLVALARKPRKISQMSASVKERAANRDRSSVRRALRLPCTLAELD